jgi:ankyrin repeat protein
MTVQYLRDGCPELGALALKGLDKGLEKAGKGYSKLVDHIRANAGYHLAPTARSAKEGFYAMARKDERVAMVPTVSILPILVASWFCGVLTPVLVSAAVVGMTCDVLVNYPEDLHEAICSNSIETAKTMIRELPSKKLALRDGNGRTPLHYAIQDGHTEIAQSLIEKLDLDQLSLHDNNGRTPLHYAIQHGQTEVSKALIKKFALVPELLCRQIHLIIHEGSINVVRALFELLTSEQLSLQSAFGNTSLHLAAERGSTGIVSMLVNRLSSDQICLKNNNGKTPLQMALIHNHQPAAQVLIRHSDPEALKMTFQHGAFNGNSYEYALAKGWHRLVDEMDHRLVQSQPPV